MSHSTTDPGSPPCDADGLVGRLLAEMTAAWARGERPRAEDFLAGHPQLWDEPEAAAELIYEEICLRERHGEEVSTEGVLQRFPRWRAELGVLLDCRRLFEPGGPPRWPAAGQTHGEFRLVAELGRGGAGVVFLATQPALDDRPVVLKLTPCSGSEHLRLARLQHTHIVPLYAAHDDPGRGVRTLCMPYFGGTSLSRLLAALDERPPSRRTGKDLLDAVDRVQAAAPIAVPALGSARQVLARASYVQAVCWIGSCLAGALHYAHEHGLIHLDLKPANVLLTADGQPMLLDFHLARAPLAAGASAVDGVGGTPESMSPEQQAALAAVRAGRPVPAAVDARSDVYALGVLLYRTLGGPLPAHPRAVRQLRRTNPAVSRGLADILTRCLAPAATDRYADAAALAADLQCHLKDLPLRGVGNRSLAERWRKWRRRRPYVFPLSLALAVVLSAALAGAAGSYYEQLEQGRAALAEGTARLEEGRHAEAVAVLKRGLHLAGNLPLHTDLAAALRDRLRRAEDALEAQERRRAAAELHQLADRVRLLAGGAVPPAVRPGLEAACRSVWERRTAVLARLGGTEAGATAVRQDLLDLALFWTELRIALAAAEEKQAARLEALRVLEEAEALFGTSPVLLHRRARYAAAAGRDEVARAADRRRAALPPRTAWEHLALGRSLLEAGNAQEAAGHFARALELQPDQLWPHFYQGLCACRLKQYADAVDSFSVCIGLAPKAARCYYNRACAYAGCGRTAAALRDLDRALQLEPTLTAAALERARLVQKREKE